MLAVAGQLQLLGEKKSVGQVSRILLAGCRQRTRSHKRSKTLDSAKAVFIFLSICSLVFKCARRSWRRLISVIMLMIIKRSQRLARRLNWPTVVAIYHKRLYLCLLYVAQVGTYSSPACWRPKATKKWPPMTTTATTWKQAESAKKRANAR